MSNFPVVTTAWNPWRELRTRPHITFRRTRLPDGLEAFWARRGESVAIAVDSGLGRRQRAAALGHELIHDERGPVGENPINPNGWAFIEAGEERVVDEIVADRLLDGGEVLAFAQRRAELGEGTTAVDVAEEFDCAVWVAANKLERLT